MIDFSFPDVEKYQKWTSEICTIKHELSEMIEHRLPTNGIYTTYESIDLLDLVIRLRYVPEHEQILFTAP